ncbi:MAG: glycosyltransferase family 4 protein [Dysgonomonas sp.]
MDESSKIHFVLPFKARRPAGGFRVMYEYANRLFDKGYSVHISYPLQTPYMKYRFPYWIRLILSRIEGFGTNKWFKFREGISMSYIKCVKDQYIKDADIIMATWWATVAEVGKLSEKKGKKINLIQGFENWEGHEDLLYKSYDIPDMTNVVVASYLKDIVGEHTDKETILIPNAIDKKQYKIMNPIKNRYSNSICMFFSEQEIKGSKYGLEALSIVKKRKPDVKADIFGIYPKPEHLPNWIEYHRNPNNLCEIYNRNAIFISNSLTEGFGLVSVEAMHCGCALICTDISGHREYAF